MSSRLSERPRKARSAFVAFVFGYSLGRALLVTAIPRCQKTSHPKKPAIKLPTMELAKLTTSLFSQRQGAVWTTRHTKGHERREMLSCVSRSFAPFVFQTALHHHSPDGKKLA